MLRLFPFNFLLDLILLCLAVNLKTVQVLLKKILLGVEENALRVELFVKGLPALLEGLQGEPLKHSHSCQVVQGIPFVLNLSCLVAEKQMHDFPYYGIVMLLEELESFRKVFVLLIQGISFVLSLFFALNTFQRGFLKNRIALEHSLYKYQTGNNESAFAMH